jgi:Uma2 family endonuclease
MLNIRAIAPIKEEQYLQICEDNPDLKPELDQDGTLIVMLPTGGITGNRNSEINYQLRTWNKQKNLGKAFDSSTEFKLPSGAFRSPDAAWISKKNKKVFLRLPLLILLLNCALVAIALNLYKRKCNSTLIMVFI